MIAHLMTGLMMAMIAAPVALISGAGLWTALGLYVAGGIIGALGSAMVLAWRLRRLDWQDGIASSTSCLADVRADH